MRCESNTANKRNHQLNKGISSQQEGIDLHISLWGSYLAGGRQKKVYFLFHFCSFILCLLLRKEEPWIGVCLAAVSSVTWLLPLGRAQRFSVLVCTSGAKTSRLFFLVVVVSRVYTIDVVKICHSILSNQLTVHHIQKFEVCCSHWWNCAVCVNFNVFDENHSRVIV